MNGYTQSYTNHAIEQKERSAAETTFNHIRTQRVLRYSLMTATLDLCTVNIHWVGVFSTLEGLSSKNNAWAKMDPAVIQGVLKIVPRLCVCWGGAKDLLPQFIYISLPQFILRGSGFNLEFGTSFELIWQFVADLWPKKSKKVVTSKQRLYCSPAMWKLSKLSKKGY